TCALPISGTRRPRCQRGRPGADRHNRRRLGRGSPGALPYPIPPPLNVEPWWSARAIPPRGAAEPARPGQSFGVLDATGDVGVRGRAALPPRRATPATQCAGHRLGLVRGITVLDLPAQAEGMRSLGGLQHNQLSDREYLLSFDSGATALVGRQLWLTHIARREVAHEFLRWRVLTRAEVGSPLAYRPPRGEGPRRADAATELGELGAVTRILPI